MAAKTVPHKDQLIAVQRLDKYRQTGQDDVLYAVNFLLAQLARAESPQHNCTLTARVQPDGSTVSCHGQIDPSKMVFAQAALAKLFVAWRNVTARDVDANRALEQLEQAFRCVVAFARCPSDHKPNDNKQVELLRALLKLVEPGMKDRGMLRSYGMLQIGATHIEIKIWAAVLEDCDISLDASRQLFSRIATIVAEDSSQEAARSPRSRPSDTTTHATSFNTRNPSVPAAMNSNTVNQESSRDTEAMSSRELATDPVHQSPNMSMPSSWENLAPGPGSQRPQSARGATQHACHPYRVPSKDAPRHSSDVSSNAANYSKAASRSKQHIQAARPLSHSLIPQQPAQYNQYLQDNLDDDSRMPQTQDFANEALFGPVAHRGGGGQLCSHSSGLRRFADAQSTMGNFSIDNHDVSRPQQYAQPPHPPVHPNQQPQYGYSAQATANNDSRKPQVEAASDQTDFSAPAEGDHGNGATHSDDANYINLLLSDFCESAHT
ncbi:hypothetical protein Slin15195_G129700 [Septoria linicola]|uniref:Uncharacterized protein n=1 Tax=Septoria linicola TaxID=215465 RepID=A0A9Q9BB21_9PEZI|nr:hypothetical protein Slin14017_G128720 [Septoria linicola]USW59651.1 hypothetical protein Slin15195_G129700 [Septoria linicola]